MSPPRRLHRLPVILLAMVCLPTGSAGAAPSWADAQKIFSARCTVCHSGKDAPLGLRLDTLDDALKGSARGPVLKPNNAKESELIRRVKGESQPRMPLIGDPLSAEEIARLEAWVAAGLPAGEAVAPAAASPEKVKPIDPNRPPTFTEVESIFLKRCAKCHKDNGIMGAPPEGLRLDSYANVIAGGERVALIPGKPDHSELIRRVEGKAEPRMPFDGPPWLEPEDIALLRRWIAEGAKDKDGRPAPIPVGREVRFRGKMTGPFSVDGARYLSSGDIRIDNNPRPGDQIEVRGTVDTEGNVRATRLRQR